MNDLVKSLRKGVRHFWSVRHSQGEKQGTATGQRDQGERAAVTGGKQMDGFVEAVCSLLVRNGIPKSSVFRDTRVELPGYFRPEKKWDLVVVDHGELLACIEFKSHIGPSFGNNYNNRTEEALGNATDLWTAYREGAFAPSARPWLGYLMLLEESPGSLTPVNVREPHFRVFEEFRGASYAKRYEILLLKLLRERLYDGVCLLLTDRVRGQKGAYREPVAELTFQGFVGSLTARAVTHARKT